MIQFLKRLFCSHVYILEKSTFSHTYEVSNWDLYSGYEADVDVYIDTFKCVKCNKVKYEERRVINNERYH